MPVFTDEQVVKKLLPFIFLRHHKGTKLYQMVQIIKWLKASNRWKHLLGGVLIGIGANTWYCSIYTGVGVAAALELKDKMWGGKWDWIDLSLTAIGAIIGQTLRTLI